MENGNRESDSKKKFSLPIPSLIYAGQASCAVRRRQAFLIVKYFS